MSDNPVTYEQMLAKIDPKIGGTYIFASLPSLPKEVEPMALIQEQEGVTVALSLDDAKKLGVDLSDPYTIITLSAPGSLDVVGLNSGISQVLSSRSIPANIFSGIYHTHVFVPSERATEANELLDDISGQAKAWLHI